LPWLTFAVLVLVAYAQHAIVDAITHRDSHLAMAPFATVVAIVIAVTLVARHFVT